MRHQKKCCHKSKTPLSASFENNNNKQTKKKRTKPRLEKNEATRENTTALKAKAQPKLLPRSRRRSTKVNTSTTKTASTETTTNETKSTRTSEQNEDNVTDTGTDSAAYWDWTTRKTISRDIGHHCRECKRPFTTMHETIACSKRRQVNYIKKIFYPPLPPPPSSSPQPSPQPSPLHLKCVYINFVPMCVCVCVCGEMQTTWQTQVPRTASFIIVVYCFVFSGSNFATTSDALAEKPILGHKRKALSTR